MHNLTVPGGSRGSPWFLDALQLKNAWFLYPNYPNILVILSISNPEHIPMIYHDRIR